MDYSIIITPKFKLNSKLMFKLRKFTNGLESSIMLEQLDSGEFIAFLYYKKNRLIAWATLEEHLVNVFVKKNYRLKGIGKILFKEVYYYHNNYYSEQLIAYPADKGGKDFFRKQSPYMQIF